MGNQGRQTPREKQDNRSPKNLTRKEVKRVHENTAKGKDENRARENSNLKGEIRARENTKGKENLGAWEQEGERGESGV